eukprot:TRINITY_DN8338_c0_g1_i1.p1 TRINITY_DN8338_c0_g1~~TRINITY_DN8338_c0_g1_i1.p1  ORF type:complete len:513 (-),score=140.07 TRINITY_DN8338_c0_g1_i1:135-1673(-)
MIERNTAIASVASGIFVCFLFNRYQKLKKRAIFTTDRPELDGPKPTFGVGNLVEVSGNVHILLNLFMDWRQTYGDCFSYTVPGFRIHFVSRPEWVEHVQKTNFDNYVKGKPTTIIVKDFLGTGIFGVDGDLWNIQRKTSVHIFTANSFRGIISTSITDHLEIFKRILENYCDSGKSVALNELFGKLTLDTFVSMAFGRELNTMNSVTPVPFASAFDFAQEHMNLRISNPLWRITEIFSEKGRQMKEAASIIDKFALEMVEERKKDLRNEVDLLSLYLKMKDENGDPYSAQQVRDAVINLVLAGRDTTSQTLSWIFYYLIRDKSHLQKLRSEIKEVLGNESVSYDNYKGLVYSMAVFHETLRLHPPVPKAFKQALKDDQLPNGGPFVKAGEWVRWSDWVMARDPNIWGSDCGEFKPERWINEDGTLKRINQWKFHAFNGGPRLCIGQNLASFQTVATMAMILRNFELSFEEGWYENVEKVDGRGWKEDTPMYIPSLTLPMKSPMLVKVNRNEP